MLCCGMLVVSVRRCVGGCTQTPPAETSSFVACRCGVSVLFCVLHTAKGCTRELAVKRVWFVYAAHLLPGQEQGHRKCQHTQALTACLWVCTPHGQQAVVCSSGRLARWCTCAFMNVSLAVVMTRHSFNECVVIGGSQDQKSQHSGCNLLPLLACCFNHMHRHFTCPSSPADSHTHGDEPCNHDHGHDTRSMYHR